MNLYPFFVWCDGTMLGQWVRGNTWAFPLTETIHIIALTVLLGSLFVIDLRLMGAKMRDLVPSRMQRELHRYINWSIVVILLTGVMLFLSEATKTYHNGAFPIKIVLLGLALAYHYTVHRKALETETPPVWARYAGALSLLLWFSVGAAGRAIGFV
jgi:uncharacterized membrane protein